MVFLMLRQRQDAMLRKIISSEYIYGYLDFSLLCLFSFLLMRKEFKGESI